MPVALDRLNAVLRSGQQIYPFLEASKWVDAIVVAAPGASAYAVPTVTAPTAPFATLPATKFRVIATVDCWLNQFTTASVPSANVITGVASIYIPAKLPYCFSSGAATLSFYITAAGTVGIEAWF